MLFEAQDRLGGRVRPVEGLAGDEWAESGGFGINSNDRGLRRLVGELGLSLVDTFKGYGDGTIVYRYGDRNHRWSDFGPAFRATEDAERRTRRRVARRSPGARTSVLEGDAASARSVRRAAPRCD
jgi:monoamine oxidase